MCSSLSPQIRAVEVQQWPQEEPVHDAAAEQDHHGVQSQHPPQPAVPVRVDRQQQRRDQPSTLLQMVR